MTAAWKLNWSTSPDPATFVAVRFVLRGQGLQGCPVLALPSGPPAAAAASSSSAALLSRARPLESLVCSL